MRIRIAVCVSRDGKWRADGGSTLTDGDAASNAYEFLDESADLTGVVHHFVEATVPMPESVTVEGEVKPGAS